MCYQRDFLYQSHPFQRPPSQPGIMILKVCGEGPIVSGFPNADIAIATGGNGNSKGSFKGMR